jgi:type VI secretion system secreted protein VgrG
MGKKFVEPSGSGELRPQRVPTGASHTFVARTLRLDHRYHDDDPVQEASFTVKLSSGFELSGKLDKQGKATLIGVSERAKVRYGPDQREYARADDRENPDHREELSESDIDGLFAKYRR